MTALAADKQYSRKEAGLKAYPVADNVNIYKGALTMKNAAGFADAATDTAGTLCLGVAYERTDNTLTGHVVGGKTIRVESGGHVLLVGSGFSQASVGLPVYVVDSGTVGLASTNSIYVGDVSEYVSATSAWIFIPDRRNKA